MQLDSSQMVFAEHYFDEQAREASTHGRVEHIGGVECYVGSQQSNLALLVLLKAIVEWLRAYS